MIVIYIAHTLISNTYRVKSWSSLCYFHASDTDGGNALNVQRTVKDLIAAGAAGCFLEFYVKFLNLSAFLWYLRICCSNF
ncbi:hypothetical protein WN943_008499 [Citrus x changshan-huyou]